MRMSKVPVLAIFCVLAGVGVAPAQSRSFERTLDLAPGGSVKMKTYKGSIHLSSWDRGAVEVSATIEAPSDVDADYARQIVEATRVVVEKRGNSIDIRSDYSNVPSQKGWMGGTTKVLPFVHYTIQVPREVNFSLDDYKSETEVYEINGNLKLSTYKGTVKASAVDGDIHLNTYKGTVNFQGARGSVSAETYKGKVIVAADSLTGDSRFETYKGTMTLIVPPSIDLDLGVELGRRGDFDSEFALATHDPDDRDWTDRLHAGGPMVRFKTVRGSFHLRKQ